MKELPPLGMIDSGWGGVCLASHVWQADPTRPIVIYADGARYPYGSCSLSAIEEAVQIGCSFLQQQAIEQLFIGCNSGSCSWLRAGRGGSKVGEVVSPTVEALCRLPSFKRIALVATEATLASGLYQELVAQRLGHVEWLSFAVAELVAAIEQSPVSQRVFSLAEELAKRLLLAEVEVALLACTHFSWVAPFLRARLPPSLILVDSGESGANALLQDGEGGFSYPETSCPSQVRLLLTAPRPEWNEPLRLLFGSYLSCELVSHQLHQELSHTV